MLYGGVSRNGGTPHSWIVCFMHTIYIEMDDSWGFPYDLGNLHITPLKFTSVHPQVGFQRKVASWLHRRSSNCLSVSKSEAFKSCLAHGDFIRNQWDWTGISSAVDQHGNITEPYFSPYSQQCIPIPHVNTHQLTPIDPSYPHIYPQSNPILAN